MNSGQPRDPARGPPKPRRGASPCVREEAPVTIEHSPEVFAIASPGPLVAGVTPGNILTHPSTPRNPALARAARVLGLAEEVGRGVDRMFREMIRSGRDLPKIESVVDLVRVTLLGGTANAQVALIRGPAPGAGA